MAKLNAEVDTASASRYTVRYYPTICVLKEDGSEIDRVVGYFRAPEYIRQVEDYLAGRNTLNSMLGEESAKSDSADFVFRLADKLSYHGRFPESRQRYLRVVSLDPENRTGDVDDALYALARMSRKDKDYEQARQYAQTILDRYSRADMMKPAFLEVGINYKREGALPEARRTFLDYVKRFPTDEDTPWAQEQADTIAAKLRRPPGA
jgi:tetratricopeptide (TPR) repeat protein